jgi:hypothetical protein
MMVDWFFVMCHNPGGGKILAATLFSFKIASDAVIGSAIVGCVILALIAFISEDKRRPSLILFSRNIVVFMVPLLIVFAYLVLVWGAKILTG